MRLDTRLDLVEARALYLRQGWVEVPAFSEDDYAEVWYAKPLRDRWFAEICPSTRCREDLHDPATGARAG